MIGKFTPEAKSRVALLGASAIAQFLDELPPSARNKVGEMLPLPTGFRNKGPNTVKKKFENLVLALSHAADNRSRSSEKDWAAFAFAWHIWAGIRFAGKFEQALEKADAATSDPAADPGLTLLQSLIGALGESRAARENIETLMLFSRFVLIENVKSRIAGLPTKVDIESRERVARLPSAVETLETLAAEQTKRLNTLEEAISRLAQAKAEEEQQIAAVIKDSRGLAPQIDQQRAELAETKEALAVGSKTSGATIAEVRADLVELTKASAALSDRIAVADERSDEAAGKIEVVCGQLEQLSRAVEAISINSGNSGRSADIGKTASSDIAPTFALRALNCFSLSPDVPMESIADQQSAVSLLASNYRAIGVLRSDAEALAAVAVGALSVGQFLQFNGSLARLLTDITGYSFGRGKGLCAEVPVGLADGQLARLVRDVIASLENSPPCLVLHGVNKSAFEVYGNDIRDTIIQRQFGIESPSAYTPLIASWVDGPAILPTSPHLLELGPLINTDRLNWGKSQWKDVRAGTVDPAQWRSFTGDGLSDEETADAIALINGLALPSNRLREMVVVRALNSLPSSHDVDPSTALGLTIGAWVAPWALVHGETEGGFVGAIKELAPEVLESGFVARMLGKQQK